MVGYDFRLIHKVGVDEEKYFLKDRENIGRMKQGVFYTV
jgi:hypothetical protein